MQATFSAPVAVRGVPGIDLQVGERVVVARYVSGSGTTLRFEYVIMLGDYDENGIGLSLERDSESPFRLDGAAIVDAVAGAGIGVDLRHLRRSPAEARKPQGRGAPPGRDRGVDGVLAGERGHLRDRRDRHGAPHDARGRDGGAARAPACLAGGRRRGAPGRVFRAGGERDAGPRILVHGAGGRPRHRRRAAVLERPSGHRLRADPPERRHHPRVAGRPRRRARHAEAERAGRAQGGRNGDCIRHRCAQRRPARPEIRVPEDWALVPSGVERRGKFRLLFITSTGRSATPKRHRRAVQPVRAGAGECRTQRDQALQGGVPGGSAPRTCNARDEHLRHR